MKDNKNQSVKTSKNTIYEVVKPKDVYKWRLIGGTHSFLDVESGKIVKIECGSVIDIKASCKAELPSWAKGKFELVIG